MKPQQPRLKTITELQLPLIQAIDVSLDGEQLDNYRMFFNVLLIIYP